MKTIRRLRLSALIAVIALILTACNETQQTPQMQAHSPANVILVDVRTAAEFAAGHLPGAVNIEIGDLLNELEGLENAPIMLYCRAGVRSRDAFNHLANNGFIHVMDIGAMDNIYMR
jgi:phage shock protein E